MLTAGASSFTLQPDGLVLSQGLPIGTWSGTTQTFTLNLSGQNTVCSST
ncbi:MAG: hypothetical protein KIT84_40415 [Labilithrix sp.]|nr:hypothetical protein [Labilithrix sp.]MCW5817332.1 hypothetical protein [Labilithrix sp.]